MRVELWQSVDVNPDGTIGDPVDPSKGAIEVLPLFRSSREPYHHTPSLRASGDWCSVSTGRLPDGTVTGITLYFNSRDEMQKFIADSGVS